MEFQGPSKNNTVHFLACLAFYKKSVLIPTWTLGFLGVYRHHVNGSMGSQSIIIACAKSHTYICSMTWSLSIQGVTSPTVACSNGYVDIVAVRIHSQDKVWFTGQIVHIVCHDSALLWPLYTQVDVLIKVYAEEEKVMYSIHNLWFLVSYLVGSQLFLLYALATHCTDYGNPICYNLVWSQPA